MLFNANILQVTSENMLPIIPRMTSLASTSWTGIVVFLSLLLLVTVFSINRNHYLSQLRNIQNSRGRTMIYHQEQTSVMADIFLWVVVILGISLFAYSFYIIYSQNTEGGIVTFLFIALSSSLLLGIKWLIFSLLGNILNLQEKQANYTKSYFISVAVFSLVLLLISIVCIYSPNISNSVFYITTLVLYLVFLIFVLFKAIQIFYEGLGSLFYIFLYLCSLEIMPTMLVLKVASMV